MKPVMPREAEIAEALDDIAFGESVQREADWENSFSGGPCSLFYWFLNNYWELQWACGERAVMTLDLEMLWAAVHHPDRVTPLGAGKWFQSRARRLQEPTGWYCSSD